MGSLAGQISALNNFIPLVTLEMHFDGPIALRFETLCAQLGKFHLEWFVRWSTEAIKCLN